MGSRTGRRHIMRHETSRKHSMVLVTTHTHFPIGVLCRTCVEVHRQPSSPDRAHLTSDVFAPCNQAASPDV